MLRYEAPSQCVHTSFPRSLLACSTATFRTDGRSDRRLTRMHNASTTDIERARVPQAARPVPLASAVRVGTLRQPCLGKGTYCSSSSHVDLELFRFAINLPCRETTELYPRAAIDRHALRLFSLVWPVARPVKSTTRQGCPQARNLLWRSVA